MEFKNGDLQGKQELVELYDAVGWVAYTRDPDTLSRAVRRSLHVVTAREGGRLVGLARVVGDGETIAYLQDLLVMPSHQRRGVGRELLNRAFAPYEHVRQKVLLTDDSPVQRAFYESVGFSEAGRLAAPLRTFVKLGS